MGKLIHRRNTLGPIRSAEEQGKHFASSIVGPESGQLQRLRQLSAKELQKAYQTWKEVEACQPGGDNGCSVVVGTLKEPAIIAESPFIRFAKGRQLQVPLIIGNTSDEGSVVVDIVKAASPFYPRHMHSFLHPMPCEHAARSLCEVDQFKPNTAWKLRELYPGLDGCLGDDQFQKAYEDIIGDHIFGRYGYMLATLHAKCQPTFYYSFKRVPKPEKQRLGAAHAAELFFVHGTRSPADSYDEADLKLGEVMRKHWTNFASRGDPNSDSVPQWQPLNIDSNGGGLKWMEFDRHLAAMKPCNRIEKFEALLEPFRRQLIAFEDPRLRASISNSWRQATVLEEEENRRRMSTASSIETDGTDLGAYYQRSSWSMQDRSSLRFPSLMQAASTHVQKR
eukprot:TRINITY_DN35505_c0_g1_i1.p1 TRINITY_DN35505_c0_g1~~TRINITY_DN35505_c0_g1_i1.p1  ORF type:complete len:393 (+),score=50.56 TRINITY_DN35505_c0_g1_i1:1147-2325(+)